MRKTLVTVTLVAVLVALAVGLASGCANDGRSGKTQQASGVNWIWNDLPKGQSLAKEQGKRVLLYFWAIW